MWGSFAKNQLVAEEVLSGEAGDKSGKGQGEEDMSLTVVLHQWSSSGIWMCARLRNDNRGPGTLGAVSDRTVTQCLFVLTA